MQKFSLTFYFIILIFVFETVSGKESAGRSSLTVFLELQKSHCGAVSLCTIKAENNGSLHTPLATCCKQCSCDAACVEMGTCCPDYKLNNKMGDTLITNISDLSDLLQYFNGSYGHIMQERNETQQKPKHASCVEAKAAKNLIRYNFPHMRSFYWMVHTCPYDMNGNDDTVRKCIDDAYLTSKGSQSEPSRLVPVTSLKTNITYKNVYCFQCNEPESSADNLWPWRAIYECTDTNIVQLFDNPYTQLQMTADGIFSCNVLYKPRPQTQQLVATCDPVGVIKCPESADKQLTEICKAYYLPVIDVKVGRWFTKYKNIACYLCNNQRAFQSDCTYFYSNNGEFSAEMNLLLDKQYNTVLQYNESEQHVLNVSINIEANSTCKTGFILSNNKVTCKRVLCPRRFYPLWGSCIPAFTQTENIYFTVIMEVLRVEKVNQATRDDFHRDYSNIVSRTAVTLFERFTYGLWQMTDDHDILVISFTMPSETMYTSMLTSLSTFLTQIASLKINIQSSTVDAVTVVSKETTIVFFAGQLRYKAGKTRLPPVHAYRGFGKALKEERLSWSHLCYRTELGPSEMYTDTRVNFYINNTKESLFAGDVQSLSNERFIVCIGDAYHNLTDANASYMFGGSSALTKAQYFKLRAAIKSFSNITRKDENQPDTDINTVSDYFADTAKGAIITVTFVCVVAIICGARFLRHRRERRIRREATNE